MGPRQKPLNGCFICRSRDSSAAISPDKTCQVKFSDKSAFNKQATKCFREDKGRGHTREVVLKCETCWEIVLEEIHLESKVVRGQKETTGLPDRAPTYFSSWPQMAGIQNTARLLIEICGCGSLKRCRRLTQEPFIKCDSQHSRNHFQLNVWILCRWITDAGVIKRGQWIQLQVFQSCEKHTVVSVRCLVPCGVLNSVVCCSCLIFGLYHKITCHNKRGTADGEL